MSNNVCPRCKRKTRSYWEGQFDQPCIDCRIADSAKQLEDHLRAAFANGIIDAENLTDRGRAVCGLPTTNHNAGDR